MEKLTVEVCYAHPHQAWRVLLPWRVGLTIKQAILESGFSSAYPGWDGATSGVGVNGKLARLDDLVATGVRIEVYRLLDFDPIVSRHRRAEHRVQDKSPARQSIKKL